MNKPEVRFVYPDDDGRRTRVWIDDGIEREKMGVQEVKGVLGGRPWVTGEIAVTRNNSVADGNGIDMFVPIDSRLVWLMGIKTTDMGIPLQVKSSNDKVKLFLKKKGMISRGRFSFEEGDYIITVNGTDSRVLVLADILGQMLALSLKNGMIKNENEFWILMQEWFGDIESVIVWSEQKEVILDYVWYKRLV